MNVKQPHICNIYNIKPKQQNLFGELLQFGFSTDDCIKTSW